jgi:hypothetical protein
MVAEAVAVCDPITVTIENCVARTGWSRSEVYRLLAAGHLRARKQASKTLIEWASVMEHHASLPPAKFGPARHAA